MRFVILELAVTTGRLGMAFHFAYVSQGKLFLKSGDAPEALHESAFARGIRDRAVELLRPH